MVDLSVTVPNISTFDSKLAKKVSPWKGNGIG